MRPGIAAIAICAVCCGSFAWADCDDAAGLATQDQDVAQPAQAARTSSGEPARSSVGASSQDAAQPEGEQK